MESLGDNEYECFTCRRVFRTPVFDISREWERTHFNDGIPSVEIKGSYGLECYCSRACVDARRQLVMASEGVPIRRPGIGPVETCAKCGAPVDMAEFHLTYVESQAVSMGDRTLDTIDVDYLAVLCRQCRPMESTASTLQQKTSTDATLPRKRVE